MHIFSHFCYHQYGSMCSVPVHDLRSNGESATFGKSGMYLNLSEERQHVSTDA
jgi:hypothetical protein